MAMALLAQAKQGLNTKEFESFMEEVATKWDSLKSDLGAAG